jgi:hypothetical protein
LASKIAGRRKFLGVSHPRGQLDTECEEEFFADPAAFGWVIEKGQAPSIHSMLLGVWHPLHSPARIITPAERLAFALRKLPRMRTRRNRSAVNSYSGSAPCGVEAATKVN